MRFMVLVKADDKSEAGVLPTTEEFAEMGRFNEELVKAGIMLAGEGLHPSSKGLRVQFSKGTPKVIDGPFAETRELVAGYWLWEVRSRDEALAWARRIPAKDGVVELRQVYEEAEFGDGFTPELREQEARLRAEIEKQKG